MLSTPSSQQTVMAKRAAFIVVLVLDLAVVAFLVGFSISFHVLFTIHSLLRKQTDLDGPGVLPSLVLILVCNTCFLVLAFQILAPEQIEVLEFFSNSIDNSVAILVSIINYFQ